MSSQNIYSQSFNFSSFIHPGVDPRTGQYTCSIGIYETPAETRNCPPLNLSLNFNPLNTTNIGFGKGWALNLSSYQHRQSKTLSLSTGEHYQASETSSTLSLKDQKLKCVRFEKKDNNYHVIHKSGLIEILSNVNNTYETTVPIKLYSASGRSLDLLWTRSGQQPRLNTIRDGSQDLVKLDYQLSRVQVTRLPGTAEASTFTFMIKNSLLAQLKLPEADNSRHWEFNYESFNQITCLAKVTNPAGLVEKVNHRAEGHKLPKGAPYTTLPFVISHIVRPGNSQPSITNLYSYSDHNFLGYSGSSDWKAGEDNLFRAPADYQYQTTVRLDGGGIKTKYTYNKFHLLTDTEQRSGSKSLLKKVIYYALKSTAFVDQPAQYQLPKRIETIYLDAVKGTSRTTTSEFTFDEWGNPTLEIHEDGTRVVRSYYPSGGETDNGTGTANCPADSCGFQRYIKAETVAPANDQALTRSKTYTYIALPTTANTLSSHFVAAKGLKMLEGNKIISDTECIYINNPNSRDHGRLQEQITRVSEPYHTTKSWNYQYSDTGLLTETIQTKSFDGYIVNSEVSHSMFSGLIVSEKDPAGVETCLQYDKLGRLVKATTSPGTPYEATKEYEYSVLDGRTGYCLTITDAKGMKVRSVSDGLQRVCSVEMLAVDVDDKAFRVVKEQKYDKFNRCTEVIDVDWLKTSGTPIEQRSSYKLEYDDWGFVCKTIHGNGLTILSVMDPIGLTHTSSIEGEGQTIYNLNPLGVPTEMHLLGSDNVTAYSKTNYSYDGLGRLIEKIDNRGMKTSYVHDSFDRLIDIIRVDGSHHSTAYAGHSAAKLPVCTKINNHAVGEQTFDGINRLQEQNIGGRKSTLSYDGNYPEPQHAVSPRGLLSSFEYDSNLDYALKSLATTDNISTYCRDPLTTALVQAENSYASSEFLYSDTGLIQQQTLKIKDGAEFTATSTYSLAGKLQHYVDVHGLKQEIEYDTSGRPCAVSQGNVKVKFDYDLASRVSKSHVREEATGLNLVTHLNYDDFGREVQRTLQKDDKTVHRLIQTYNEIGLIATRELTEEEGNQTPQTLRFESYEYDSTWRLTGYSSQGSSQLPIDDRGNGIKQQKFSFDQYGNMTKISTELEHGESNTTTYHFENQKDPSQLTQITNSHPHYPTRVDLAYDADGRLIEDEEGRILEYNDMGRLDTVRNADGHLICQYRYDATGKLVCQKVPGQPDRILSYRGETLVAETVGDNQISYISDGKRYWGRLLCSQGGDLDSTSAQLWHSNGQGSVLTWLDTLHPNEISDQWYTPYGFSVNGGPSIGFNGQWRDPATGWYHLGNGYRVYNPVLMRFHTPDTLSPFVSGEINPYIYCMGDPVNRVDPTGHFSIFGIELTARNLVLMGVGLGVGILVGVLTAGAGFAIVAGASIAMGALTDAAAGAVYDIASGKSPTWQSIGTDALLGAFGAALGEVGGILIQSGGRAAIKGISRALGRSGSVAISKAASRAGEFMGSLEFNTLSAEVRGFPNWKPDIVYFNKLNGQFGNEGILTHGSSDGRLLGIEVGTGMFRLGPNRDVVRDTFVLTLRDAEERIYPSLAQLPPERRTLTLFSCHGANGGAHGAGQELANATGREVTCFYGEVTPMGNWYINQLYNRLEMVGGASEIYGHLRHTIRRPVFHF
ncbi:hypothetical protein FQN57_001623 [Myotisia sp. PD_48]|nr:hypothetical protein FQN57_001623 [Myotisia sp. PD_48]